MVFNNVFDRKETFVGHKKFNLSKSQKSHFSKEVNPCFLAKKCNCFLYLFPVKIRVKIMFKIKKKPFWAIKKFNLSKC